MEASGFHGDCANFLLYKSTEESAESPPAAPVSAILSRMSEHGSSHSDAGDGPERDSGRCSGLPLPEVVNELLKDSSVLRWDHALRCYEVMDGFKFEEKFNQLRRVRQRHKNGTAERPFSRMHNFYVLERGEKWAKTGSLFRPKNTRLAPTLDPASGHTLPSPHNEPSLPTPTSEGAQEEDHGDFNGMAVLSGACSLALSLPLSSPTSASSASTPAVPILPPLPACPPLAVSNLLQSPHDWPPPDPATAFQRKIIPDVATPMQM